MSDVERKNRPTIAPDDTHKNRAMIVSRAVLEELAFLWFTKGILVTGERFHGETPAVHHPDMQTMIKAAFDNLWAKRATE